MSGKEEPTLHIMCALGRLRIGLPLASEFRF